MRDKKDATEFIRSIDRTHHSNIRVVVPPTIDNHLKNPDKIRFEIINEVVVVSNAKE